METATWMQMGGVAGLGASLLAGLLFSFTPVAFASIPVVLAYVTRARAFREALSYGLAFAAGLILTHVVLGVGAALGGAWAQSLLSRQWGVLLGPLLILLGLLWTACQVQGFNLLLYVSRKTFEPLIHCPSVSLSKDSRIGQPSSRVPQRLVRRRSSFLKVVNSVKCCSTSSSL